MSGQPTWRTWYSWWRGNAVVQHVLIALGLSAGFLGWSPLSSDSLELVLVLLLVVSFAALGFYEQRDS